jgi:hypothetical protein
MKKTRQQLESAQTIVALDGVATKLRDARAAANHFAATSSDAAGRSLLGLSIGAHLSAMRRLQLQLEAPLPAQQTRKKKNHAKQN